MPSVPVYCYLCGRRINGSDLLHQLPGGLALSVCRPPERDCNARLGELIREALPERAVPKRLKTGRPVDAAVTTWDGPQGALTF